MPHASNKMVRFENRVFSHNVLPDPCFRCLLISPRKLIHPSLTNVWQNIEEVGWGCWDPCFTPLSRLPRQPSSALLHLSHCAIVDSTTFISEKIRCSFSSSCVLTSAFAPHKGARILHKNSFFFFWERKIREKKCPLYLADINKRARNVCKFLINGVILHSNDNVFVIPHKVTLNWCADDLNVSLCSPQMFPGKHCYILRFGWAWRMWLPFCSSVQGQTARSGLTTLIGWPLSSWLKLVVICIWSVYLRGELEQTFLLPYNVICTDSIIHKKIPS